MTISHVVIDQVNGLIVFVIENGEIVPKKMADLGCDPPVEIYWKVTARLDGQYFFPREFASKTAADDYRTALREHGFETQLRKITISGE